MTNEEKVSLIENKLRVIDQSFANINEVMELAYAEICKVMLVPLWSMHEMHMRVRDFEFMMDDFQKIWNHQVGQLCNSSSEKL